jgi:mono/diheme cytochrome c family protein
MKIKIFTIALTGFLIAGLFNRPVNAQDGTELFKTCAACHSIGGGKIVGPDLKGITKRRTNDWLINFVQSPVRMMKSGDADAIAIFKEFNNLPMPDNALTADQINKILAHIDGGDVGGKAVDPQIAAKKQQLDSLLKSNSKEGILAGKELFNGTKRFQNGGVSCASCHNATYNSIGKGGNLAKDLTKVFSRLGGFAGIKGIIAAPPFPSMNESYKNHPITDEENTYIQLFLKSTDDQNPANPIIEKAWFVYPAFILSIFIALIIAAIWIRRKTLSVNQVILDRQIRQSK